MTTKATFILGILAFNKVLSFQDVFVENCLKDVTNYQLSWWLHEEFPTANTTAIISCSDVAAAVNIVKQSIMQPTVALVSSSMAIMLQSIIKSMLKDVVVSWTKTIDDHCYEVQDTIKNDATDQILLQIKNNDTHVSMVPTELTNDDYCVEIPLEADSMENLKKILTTIKSSYHHKQLTIWVYTHTKDETSSRMAIKGQLALSRPRKQKSNDELSKKFYRIGVIKSPPIMTFDVDENGVVENASGLVLDIVKTLASTLNFKYSLIPMDTYGHVTSTGAWTGAMKRLVAKEIDLLAADVVNNPSRALAVDFTVPFMQGSQRVVIRRSLQMITTNDMLRTHLKPFQWRIWLIISITIMVGTFLLYYIEFSNRDVPKRIGLTVTVRQKKANVKDVTHVERKPETWWAIFFYICGMFCQQGCDLAPAHASGRIIFFTVCMTALICYNFYTSVFISFTTVSRNAINVDNMADILKDKSFMVGFVENNQVEDLFKITTSPIYQKAWNRMLKAGNMYVSSDSEGIARTLDEKFAFIANSYRLEHVTMNNCSFKLLKDRIFQEGNHFVLPLDSPDSQVFSKYLKRMVESGMVTRMKMSHMPSLTMDKCDAGVTLEAVGLNKMAGLFVCLLGGFTFAVLSLWLEKKFNQTASNTVKRVLIQIENK